MNSTKLSDKEILDDIVKSVREEAEKILRGEKPNVQPGSLEREAINAAALTIVLLARRHGFKGDL